MKSLYRRTLINVQIPLIFILFVSFKIFASDAPIKWGDVPGEALKMKSFPGDTNATAVILCDYGKTWFSGNFDLIFEKHVRIKILSNEGKKWGRVEINFLNQI